jgi:hypothetical protein
MAQESSEDLKDQHDHKDDIQKLQSHNSDTNSINGYPNNKKSNTSLTTPTKFLFRDQISTKINQSKNTSF